MASKFLRPLSVAWRPTCGASRGLVAPRRYLTLTPSQESPGDALTASMSSIQDIIIAPTTKFTIRTLNIANLNAADIVDLSGLTGTQFSPIQGLELPFLPPKGSWPKVHAVAPPGTAVPNPEGYTMSYVKRKHSNHTPFPQGTRGVLYYHRPPHAPLAGELRFRIVDGTDVNMGHDLLLPRGTPFGIPLLALRATKKAPSVALQKLILRDGLIDVDLLYTADTLTARAPESLMQGSIIVHSLEQEFPVQFHLDGGVNLIGKDEWRFAPLQGIWTRRLPRGRKSFVFRPYAGQGVCKLELSTLPEHAGTRTIVLRLVRIIDMFVRPDQDIPDPTLHIPFPIAGELVKSPATRDALAWNIDAQDRAARKFKILLGESSKSETNKGPILTDEEFKVAVEWDKQRREIAQEWERKNRLEAEEEEDEGPMDDAEIEKIVGPRW